MAGGAKAERPAGRPAASSQRASDVRRETSKPVCAKGSTPVDDVVKALTTRNERACRTQPAVEIYQTAVQKFKARVRNPQARGYDERAVVPVRLRRRAACDKDLIVILQGALEKGGGK
jgi:hypothetical protein